MMSLALEIELLTGWYSATRFNDRRQPEWPPHPHRLFSAMVATWADADVPEAAERTMLEWFESLGAPEIICSEAHQRIQGEAYVPVNDTSVVSVGSTDRLYQQHVAALAGLQAAGDVGDDKTLAKLHKEIEKLAGKIVVESAKAGAVKPGNTGGTLKSAIELIPETRWRQARSYPVVIPDDPKVTFVWPSADPTAEQRRCLDSLLARLHRIGHSSTLVSCRVLDESDDIGTSNWFPADDTSSVDQVEMIRVTSSGLLAELELAYASHEGVEPRSLPAVQIGYGPLKASHAVPSSNLSGQLLILEQVGGRRLSLLATADLTKAVRDALMVHAADPTPELISGHVARSTGERSAGDRTTAPLQHPHMAVLPLPFVGNSYANGEIYGVALALPNDVTEHDRDALYAALERWGVDGGQLPVNLGRRGALRLQLRAVGDNDRKVLKPFFWTGGKYGRRQWASVTPVALDRHVGDLAGLNPAKRAQAEETAGVLMARACRYAGLPVPSEVRVDLESMIIGGRRARSFPAYQNGSGHPRALVHVHLRFDEPVRGPVVIGAGRYRGMGMCMPLRTAEEGGM